MNWYIGGLDNVTNWQMQTLASLGFTGYYETVTPGSGTRPDGLTQTEQQNLPNDGTTGVGAVWNLYYAQPAQQNQRHRLHLLGRRQLRRQRHLPGLATPRWR